MTTVEPDRVRYDPYDLDIDRDPYPVYRRLREEAPVYRNDEYDFWALSRHADVERALVDRSTFISGRGGILELMKAGIEMPPGVVIFEDPPTHTIHRGLLSRMFTPRKVAALEPRIRELCAACLDPLLDTDRFDVIEHLGAVMPMRVIGMLLGIPEEDQDGLRRRTDAHLRTEGGRPMDVSADFADGSAFEAYIDWRADHPADDIMTDLLNVEFEDETGTRRRLERGELLTYLSVVAGAGNETTTKLIGWFTKVLADHPDQRREIVADPSLVAAAIEETLRFEGPAPHVGRWVDRAVEIEDTVIPAESCMLLLLGSANRDDRKFPDGDSFDIHRSTAGHLAFGYGPHFCLGAALARLQGAIALDEMLRRFPQWDVDLDAARLVSTSTVRGWESLPVVVTARR
jgi:cytochrome P450